MTEQIQILLRRLECRSTKDSLKRVFNVFRRKPSLGAPESLSSPDFLNKTLWERIFGRRCTKSVQFLCVLGMCSSAVTLYILEWLICVKWKACSYIGRGLVR